MTQKYFIILALVRKFKTAQKDRQYSIYLTWVFIIFGNKKIQQAGAELCQAQSSLQLNLANYKLSSLLLNSSNQHSDH